MILSLFLFGILLRAPLIEKTQSHWDGPQYSIAIRQFDFIQETPAPPGYPLYIFFGWVSDQFIHDPHRSLLFLSVLFSGSTAVLFYFTGKILWNNTVGIIASLLYLSGPSFYFFGLTAYPYGQIPFFTLLLALCVYSVLTKRSQKGVALGIVLGVFFGFRPQELPMILPLGMLGFMYLSKKEKIVSIISFMVVSLIWAIPTIYTAGGLESYVSTSTDFIQSGAIAPFSLSKIVSHSERIAKGLFLSFTLGLLVIPLFLFKKHQTVFQKLQNKKVVFFAVWIAPSLLFNIFVRSDHAGYQMTYLSAVLLIISYMLWVFFKKKKFILVVVTVIVVVFNLFWFFRNRDITYQLPYTPTSFHYSEIVKNDIIFMKKISYIHKNFDPKHTVVLTKSQTFRPVMYYLKNYDVININILETTDPQFATIVRSARQWKKHETTLDDELLSFSKDVDTIVFFDNEFYDWVDMPSEKIYVDSWIWLTVVRHENHEYYFTYHTFRPYENN